MIGPTFPDELAAAGLVGLPFSWDSDGTIHGRENLTSQQNAKLDEVIAAHRSDAKPPDKSLGQSYDEALQDQPHFKAMLLALNDGSLVVGANRSPSQLRSMIVARMQKNG